MYNIIVEGPGERVTREFFLTTIPPFQNKFIGSEFNIYLHL